MTSVRKMDLQAQIGLGILMVASIPFFISYLFLIGLFILGIWQLLSAGINTSLFNRTGLGKKIQIYWIIVSIDLGLFFISWLLSSDTKENFLSVIVSFALIAAIGIAIYYLIIYRKLITHLKSRQDISCFTKTKF